MDKGLQGKERQISTAREMFLKGGLDTATSWNGQNSQKVWYLNQAMKEG